MENPPKVVLRDYDSFYRNHIFPHFQSQDIRLIDKSGIINFVDTLEDKVDNGQINSKTLSKIYNVFKTIIDYSVSKNKLNKNPCNSQDFLSDIEIYNREFEPIDFDYWTIEKIVQLIETNSSSSSKIIIFNYVRNSL